MITIDKKIARALLAHASDDSTRPHLAAIGFHPGAGLLAATDGYRLAMVWSVGKDGKPTIVPWLTEPASARDWLVLPRQVVERAIELCTSKGRKKADEIAFSVGERANIAVVSVRRADGQPVAPIVADAAYTGYDFPPVRRVIPDWWAPGATWKTPLKRPKAADLAQLDGRYLSWACELVEASNESVSSLHPRLLRLHGPAAYLQPSIVEGSRAMVIIMPAQL